MNKKQSGLNWKYRLVCDALRFLRDSDGSASIGQVLKHIEPSNYIPEKARQPTESDGRMKWATNFHYASTPFVIAGFLRKDRGVLSITPYGVQELAQRDDAAMTQKAQRAYDDYLRDKSAKHKPLLEPEVRELKSTEADDGDVLGDNRLNEYHDIANSGVSQCVESMDPFEFQNLVAALFRGMGYYVREVSPQNTPDGGIDVIAYQGGDVLGANTPRIKAQVKRQQSKTGKPELQKLLGAMTDGDIGVFISTGGFARGCREFAKQQNRQLELIDMPRFIELWRDNYDKLSDEDKSLLPLQPIYFLDEERVKRS